MSENIEQLIGVQIATFRKDLEITQEKLAEIIDVSTETISRLERGINIPSIKTLQKISHALHVPLKDFFDVEYPQKPGFTAFEKENTKLLALLKTKKADDIKMCYRILTEIFEQIEKNYHHKQSQKV